LNADLRFKTFHGGVYTDFDLTMPPGNSPAGGFGARAGGTARASATVGRF